MTKFIWKAKNFETAEEQRKAEWRIAHKYLDNKPPGIQINPTHGKYKVILKDPLTGKDVNLSHRYFKGINKNIYAIAQGKPLGEGSYGIVTLGQTEDYQLWAIKESEYNEEIYKYISQESKIAIDLYKADSVFHDDGNAYQIYKFLGTSLDKYLAKNQKLTRNEQFDLAIKMTKAVYHLHAGTYSKTKTKYAHLDIKPANFCIDENKNVHLIDYGFSEDLTKSSDIFKGTPIYKAINIDEINKVNRDIFALKRSIFLPKEFMFPFRSKIKTGYRFPDDYFPIKNKFEFLNTENGIANTDTAFDLLYNLISAKYSIKINQYYNFKFRKITVDLYLLLEDNNLDFKNYINEILNNTKYIQKILNNTEIFIQNQDILLLISKYNNGQYLCDSLDNINLLKSFSVIQQKNIEIDESMFLILKENIFIQKILANDSTRNYSKEEVIKILNHLTKSYYENNIKTLTKSSCFFWLMENNINNPSKNSIDALAWLIDEFYISQNKLHGKNANALIILKLAEYIYKRKDEDVYSTEHCFSKFGYNREEKINAAIDKINSLLDITYRITSKTDKILNQSGSDTNQIMIMFEKEQRQLSNENSLNMLRI